MSQSDYIGYYDYWNLGLGFSLFTFLLFYIAFYLLFCQAQPSFNSAKLRLRWSLLLKSPPTHPTTHPADHPGKYQNGLGQLVIGKESCQSIWVHTKNDFDSTYWPKIRQAGPKNNFRWGKEDNLLRYSLPIILGVEMNLIMNAQFYT